MSLTSEEYKLHSNHCPCCEESNIEASGYTDYDAGDHTARIHCNDCGARWSDLYELVGYVDLKVPL